MLLCLAVLRYRQRMLDCEGEPLPSLGTTCDAFCSFHQPVVGCCCCILLLKIYGWAVVILVRLGCWVRVRSKEPYLMLSNCQLPQILLFHSVPAQRYPYAVVFLVHVGPLHVDFTSRSAERR